MELSLDPEIQKRIEDRVRSGRYATPEEVVAAAIRSLDQHEQYGNAGATVEEQFHHLKEVWHKGVAHQSSTTVRTSHPAYRAIVALGPAVVPYLLRDLESTRAHWFSALREITGANPIPAASAGNISQMAAAWLAWAKDNGYQW